VKDEGGFPGRLLGFAHQRAGSQEGQGKLSTTSQPLKCEAQRRPRVHLPSILFAGDLREPEVQAEVCRDANQRNLRHSL
jgi:hypothetical protein